MFHCVNMVIRIEIYDGEVEFQCLFSLDSPILLSFPHFYMADQSIRTAVEGISPPEKDKHQFFIDVQPVSQTEPNLLIIS